jgi:transaldolase
MPSLRDLAALGQAAWVDYISRPFIRSGELERLIRLGVSGLTSNPTIFERAIVGSSDYDEQLLPLARAGKGVLEIYEELAVADIRAAADLLLPVHKESGGRDGFVSLEVSPELAHDTAGTVAEVRRLFALVARPNLMIKVPATDAGVPAIEQLIGEGININVTLIFSVEQYEAVALAYMAGLEKLAAAGGRLGSVSSVASFFVSRLDTAIDPKLEAAGRVDLLGKAAIANCKVAYRRFRELLAGERWRALAAEGARVQRLLWGSTSTKNPRYPDTYYVDNLIGPDTVNTMPPATLAAYLDHGCLEPRVLQGVDEAARQLEEIGSLGIDVAAETRKLLADGVAAFAASFRSLLDAIERRRQLAISPASG